jgi:hypothetical protein
MIRTVWLAITLLIGLAALTILKVVGIKPFVDQSVPLQETIGTNLQSDISARLSQAINPNTTTYWLGQPTSALPTLRCKQALRTQTVY